MGKRLSADNDIYRYRDSETQRSTAEQDKKSINFDLIYELSEKCYSEARQKIKRSDRDDENVADL